MNRQRFDLLYFGRMIYLIGAVSGTIAFLLPGDVNAQQPNTIALGPITVTLAKHPVTPAKIKSDKNHYFDLYHQ